MKTTAAREQSPMSRRSRDRETPRERDLRRCVMNHNGNPNRFRVSVSSNRALKETEPLAQARVPAVRSRQREDERTM